MTNEIWVLRFVNDRGWDGIIAVGDHDTMLARCQTEAMRDRDGEWADWKIEESHSEYGLKLFSISDGGEVTYFLEQFKTNELVEE